MAKTYQKRKDRSALVIIAIFLSLGFLVLIGPLLYNSFLQLSYTEKSEAEIISSNLFESGGRGGHKMVYYTCLIKEIGIKAEVTDFEAQGELRMARFKAGDVIIVNYNAKSLLKGQIVIAGLFTGIMIP